MQLQGVEYIFPMDVGMSLGDDGPRLRFLAADVHVSAAGRSLEVAPFNPNREYACGAAEAQEPQVNRVPLYRDPWRTPHKAITEFVVCQVLAYNQIVMD